MTRREIAGKSALKDRISRDLPSKTALDALAAIPWKSGPSGPHAGVLDGSHPVRDPCGPSVKDVPGRFVKDVMELDTFRAALSVHPNQPGLKIRVTLPY
jgi:hypothetical protein